MKDLIKEFLENNKELFVDKVTQDKCKQIYNEASLQYELAKFLEDEGYTVKIECNIRKLFENKGERLTKRDIDIVAINGENKYAIELKFPMNGRYPEEMYDFIKDIRFMEEIRKKGFNTYCLTIVGDDGFYSNEKLNKHNKAVYDCFRRDDLGIFIDKDIKYTRPTGIDIDKTINVFSEYTSKWNDLGDKNKKYKYYLIEIK